VTDDLGTDRARILVGDAIDRLRDLAETRRIDHYREETG
jgi:hypothetical protein